MLCSGVEPRRRRRGQSLQSCRLDPTLFFRHSRAAEPSTLSVTGSPKIKVQVTGKLPGGPLAAAPLTRVKNSDESFPQDPVFFFFPRPAVASCRPSVHDMYVPNVCALYTSPSSERYSCALSRVPPRPRFVQGPFQLRKWHLECCPFRGPPSRWHLWNVKIA